MRCFDQKRRFGIDLLFPISRYVDGLSMPRLPNGQYSRVFCNDILEILIDGKEGEVCNNLVRSSKLIFLAGIVGVPWQDISVDPTSLKSGYRSTKELGWTADEYSELGDIEPPPWLVGMKTADGYDATIWNVILGETVNGHEINPNVRPLDPLMFESIDMRTGTHPVTGGILGGPGTFSEAPHGSERELPLRNDLQYACIFPLEKPVDCATSTAEECDCRLSDGEAPKDPLCWNLKDGGYSTTQYSAKAYPGTRQLAVIKGMGEQAIVASICPSNLTDPDANDYGYRPAIGAIVERLGDYFGGCWLRFQSLEDDGRVDCVMYEARKVEGDCPPCVGVRAEIEEHKRRAIEAGISWYGYSGLNCTCELKQVAAGPDLAACTGSIRETALESGAWCYVSPSQNSNHNSAITSLCSPNGQGIIRFMGVAPFGDATLMLGCRSKKHGDWDD